LETRILVAILLSLGLIFAYQELVLKRLYPPPARSSAQKRSVQSASPSAPPSTVHTPAAAASPTAPAEIVTVPKGTQVPEREIEVDTEVYRAVFTSRGARLKSFELKRFHETSAPDSPLYEMVKPGPGGVLPLGAIIKRDGTIIDDRELAYTTDAPSRIIVKAGRTATLTFEARTPDGAVIRKTFTFRPASYVLNMGMQVAGGASAPDAVGVIMAQPLTARPGYYDVPELQADVSNKTITESQKSLTKGVQPVRGPIAYAGFGDRYFLSVFMPKGPTVGTLEMSFKDDEAEASLLFPGASKLETAIYMGPKELDILEAASPSLSRAIDFGWTGILALVFLRALKLLHRLAPNYGVDIILLTALLRVLFLPMSIRSQRSMIQMQRLQPQMERIREKFKDDQERIQKEMVDLYKRNHVNPIGGCLPMLLQLPIFLGLYEALLNAVELRHAPFWGWIKDLSAPDCLVIKGMPKLPLTSCGGIPVLVLLMGVSAWLQQKMSPQSPDPNQQRMMMLSPIIFTVIFVNLPAGISLYYFASNILGIVQQFFLNREFKQLSPATA
jgi:YidC/Oxa1 family membrane protein insertase